MAKEYFKINNFLKEADIAEIVDEDMQKAVADIIEDMRIKTLEAMTDFYYDYVPMSYDKIYHPKIYYRKYSLIATAPHPKVTKTSNGYHIELLWNNKAMTERHPEPHDDFIFEGPFLQGYHGGPIRRVYKGIGGVIEDEWWEDAPQSIPPWEIILQYAKAKYNAYE